MPSIFYTVYPWETTNLFIACTKKGLCKIEFESSVSEQEFTSYFNVLPVRADKPLKSVLAQLDSYFSGKKTNFDIKLDFFTGTPFQQSVWRELVKIPYGETISYAQLAYRVGNPKATRAVGSANGKNPIPVVIPCHRVIQKNGNIGGYSGGLDIKKTLLKLEGIEF